MWGRGIVVNKRIGAGCLVFVFAFVFMLNLNINNNSNNNSKRTRDDQQSSSFKLILLWTPWLDDKNWTDLFKLNQGPLLSSIINQRHCLLSTNRSLLSEADAVVFHGRDFDADDLPKWRSPKQRWVFLTMEPPTSIGSILNKVSRSKVAFNWTASYSSKADIFFPHGRLVPVKANKNDSSSRSRKIEQFVDNFSTRKTDAIWIVSNCEIDSQRELLVKLLQKNGMTIDIFGDCINQKPPLWNDSETFFSNYRYYLSLENSHCDDYVSEKLIRGLRLSQNFGVIPVAYHSSNIDYRKIGIQKKAFVDVAKFLPLNVPELAHFLLEKIPNDKAKLRNFFKWQLEREVETDTPLQSWRQMCQKLWQDHNDPPSTVDNLRATFGNCSTPWL